MRRKKVQEVLQMPEKCVTGIAVEVAAHEKTGGEDGCNLSIVYID